MGRSALPLSKCSSGPRAAHRLGRLQPRQPALNSRNLLSGPNHQSITSASHHPPITAPFFYPRPSLFSPTRLLNTPPSRTTCPPVVVIAGFRFAQKIIDGPQKFSSFAI